MKSLRTIYDHVYDANPGYEDENVLWGCEYAGVNAIFFLIPYLLHANGHDAHRHVDGNEYVAHLGDCVNGYETADW